MFCISVDPSPSSWFFTLWMKTVFFCCSFDVLKSCGQNNVKHDVSRILQTSSSSSQTTFPLTLRRWFCCSEQPAFRFMSWPQMTLPEQVAVDNRGEEFVTLSSGQRMKCTETLLFSDLMQLFHRLHHCDVSASVLFRLLKKRFSSFWFRSWSTDWAVRQAALRQRSLLY